MSLARAITAGLKIAGGMKSAAPAAKAASTAERTVAYTDKTGRVFSNGRKITRTTDQLKGLSKDQLAAIAKELNAGGAKTKKGLITSIMQERGRQTHAAAKAQYATHAKPWSGGKTSDEIAPLAKDAASKVGSKFDSQLAELIGKQSTSAGAAAPKVASKATPKAQAAKAYEETFGRPPPSKMTAAKMRKEVADRESDRKYLNSKDAMNAKVAPW